MDLNRDPMSALHGLINDVYLPFMDSMDKQAGVSELVTKDFVEKLNDYIAGIYATLGRLKNQTLLPVPFQKFIYDPAITDKLRC